MFNNSQFKSIKLILLISSHSGFIYQIIWSKNVPAKLVFCMIEQSLKFPVNVMYRSQRRIQNPVEHLRFHLRYLKWFWICLWLFLWSLHFLPPNLLTIFLLPRICIYVNSHAMVLNLTFLIVVSQHQDPSGAVRRFHW